MSMAERPGVLERLGSALNSSDLSPREGVTGAVELIGAMAYAQTNPDAAEHNEMELAYVDPRTELGSILVRLKYGGDRVLGERAVLLLAHWVRHQKAWRKWKLQATADWIVWRFVRQGLAEWLFPVCQECHGREMLGLDKGEIVEKRVRCTRCRGTGNVTLTSRLHSLETRKPVQLVKSCLSCGGRGWRMHRRPSNTKARECNSCGGTGRLRHNDSERANALGVEHRIYKRHWEKRFAWLLAGLDRIDKLEKNVLQSQLRGV